MSNQNLNDMTESRGDSTWSGAVKQVSYSSLLPSAKIYNHPELESMLHSVIPKTSSYQVQDLRSLSPEMSARAFCLDQEGQKVLKCIMNVSPVESTGSDFASHMNNKRVTLWVPKDDKHSIVITGENFDSNKNFLHKCPSTGQRIIPVWSTMTCRELMDTVDKAHSFFDVHDALNDGVNNVEEKAAKTGSAMPMPKVEEAELENKEQVNVAQTSASDAQVAQTTASDAQVAQTASSGDQDTSEDDSDEESSDDNSSENSSDESGEDEDSSADSSSDSEIGSTSSDYESLESDDESSDSSDESSESDSEDGGSGSDESSDDMEEANTGHLLDSEDVVLSDADTNSDSTCSDTEDSNAKTNQVFVCSNCKNNNKEMHSSSDNESEGDLPQEILHGKI